VNDQPDHLFFSQCWRDPDTQAKKRRIMVAHLSTPEKVLLLSPPGYPLCCIATTFLSCFVALDRSVVEYGFFSANQQLTATAIPCLASAAPIYCADFILPRHDDPVSWLSATLA
jgi:hypothetical protein